MTQYQLSNVSEIKKGEKTQPQHLTCSESAVVNVLPEMNESLKQKVATTQTHRPTRVAAQEARHWIMARPLTVFEPSI